MVITVEAGAVAEARAARTMEKFSSSPSTKKVMINTSTEARIASKTVMTMTFAPLFFSVSNLKNSPVLKAIKASAISAMKSMPPITFPGTRFRQ